MTSALARKYALDVAPYVSGTAITAVTGWTRFYGINDFNDVNLAVGTKAQDGLQQKDVQGSAQR